MKWVSPLNEFQKVFFGQTKMADELAGIKIKLVINASVHSQNRTN